MTSKERGERRALVVTARLMRERLRRVTSARIGRWFAWIVFLAFAAAAVWLRATDGPRASLEGLVTTTARVTAWASAGLVALAATKQRSLADRRDGIEVLVATRGGSVRSLGVARFLATAFEAARVIVVPAVLLDLLGVSLAGSAHVAGMRALAVLPIAVFGLVTGAVLAALAVIADVARPTTGRSFFIGAIILPYALFDLLGHPMLSVPGALNGLLSVGLDVVGLGALA